MKRSCPDDLADALHGLLTDLTFELRALTDCLRAMTRPEDAAAAAKTRETCIALREFARHVLPLLSIDDEVAFCCILEWHWHLERPRLGLRLDAGEIAFANMTIDDYDAHWRRLAPLARRELARYPQLTRRGAA